MGNPPPQDGTYGQPPPQQYRHPPSPRKSKAPLLMVIAAVVAVVVLLLLLLSPFGSIQGTWNIDSVESSVLGEPIPLSGTITFNPDGTYTTQGLAGYLSTSGVYSLNGSTVTIDGTDFTYSVSGSRLTLETTETFMGQTFTTTINCSRA